MRNDRDILFAAPILKIVYFDKIQVWLPWLLSKKEMEWVEKNSGGISHVLNEAAYFDYRLKQRLQIRRPNLEALMWLASLEGVFLNMVEFSLDWVFRNKNELMQAVNFVREHLVKKHHGDQGIRYCKQTRYTGAIWVPNKIVSYSDRPCRITNDDFCFHNEWRTFGKEALHDMGIESLDDLIRLDHHSFWMKRLLFYKIDRELFGRLYSNFLTGSKRRNARRIKCTDSLYYSTDRAICNALMRQISSAQELVDVYRKKFDVRRCLLKIEASDLIPKTSLYYDIYTGSLQTPSNDLTHLPFLPKTTPENDCCKISAQNFAGRV